MAFQSIPQSTFASGLGSSVGRGLAEQLPQQAERSVQSHKLQNLGQDFHNLTPMEQIAKLVAIPGMNAQTAMQFIPYIQQSQARKALAERAKAGQRGTGVDDVKPVAELGYEERSGQPGYLTKPNQPQIDALAQNRIETGASVDPNEAQATAKQILMDQYEADQSYEQRKQFGRDLLNNFIKETGTQVSGETKKRFA